MVKFDELNVLFANNRRSIPYDQYFGEMDLTEEQKKKRIEFSEKCEEIILFIFSLYVVMAEYNYVNRQYIVNQLKAKYSNLIVEYMAIDDYIDQYIGDFSEKTIETTINHAEDEYYTSKDRAINISENEALTVLNNSDYKEAIRAGKTKKKWVDIKDKRERETHLEVGCTVLPITEPFLVGDSLMQYPHDALTYGASAEEICNCRCTIKYF